MAGLDAELGVAAHEVRGHGDLRAVGEEDGGVGGELFDEGEDVVPAAAVEAGGVVAELVEDLVHLEGGEDGFDEDGGADGAARDAEEFLRADEDVVPEAGFEVRLELGEIEVGAGAAGEELARVVEEVEAEVEEGAGDGFAVDDEVALFEVPAAGADEEDGGVFDEGVVLVGGGVVEGDGAADGVDEVELAVEEVLPGGRGGVFEVGHEDAGAGVEGVDDHLAVDGAGDLDAAVLEVGGDGRDGPVGVSRIWRFGEEVGALRRRRGAAWRVTRAARSCLRRGLNSRWRATTKARASGVRTRDVAVGGGGVDGGAGWEGHGGSLCGCGDAEKSRFPSGMTQESKRHETSKALRRSGGRRGRRWRSGPRRRQPRMARVLPVQEPVVIHWPLRRPPVRAAPSLASQGRRRRRSPEVLEPVRSTRTTPSTASMTCSLVKSMDCQLATAGP